jgi:hypothetical protein
MGRQIDGQTNRRTDGWTDEERERERKGENLPNKNRLLYERYREKKILNRVHLCFHMFEV